MILFNFSLSPRFTFSLPYSCICNCHCFSFELALILFPISPFFDLPCVNSILFSLLNWFLVLLLTISIHCFKFRFNVTTTSFNYKPLIIIRNSFSPETSRIAPPSAQSKLRVFIYLLRNLNPITNQQNSSCNRGNSALFGIRTRDLWVLIQHCYQLNRLGWLSVGLIH
jgi:hypothetical protein